MTIFTISANQINLQGGSGPSNGNVYVDDIPICYQGFGWEEADVVCRELGYNYTQSYFTNSHFGSIPAWFLNSWKSFYCQGDELSLANCSYTEDGECSEDRGVGIVCSNLNHTNGKSIFMNCYDNITKHYLAANVTLVNGQGPQEGNVFVNGMPVCDDHWDLKDAWVVCKQLGYASVVSATQYSKFGRVPADFRMDDVQCTGEESNLLNCTHTKNHNCGASEGAGVICSSDHIGKISTYKPIL